MAEDTKAQIERLIRADPTLSAARIARALKVSRQYVSKVLDDLDYELAWRKRKEKQ